MSDIVERLRLNASPLGEWGELADRLQIEAADTIERQDAEIERLRAEYKECLRIADIRSSGIDRILGELAAEKDEVFRLQESHSRVYEELAAVKALLRGVLNGAGDYVRIRAALGDEP